MDKKNKKKQKSDTNSNFSSINQTTNTAKKNNSLSKNTAGSNFSNKKK